MASRLRAASAEQLRVVVLHQPVAVPRSSELGNVAHGAEAAVRAWHDAGADVILTGHIHLPFVLPLHEVYGLERHVWAVSAGTAISSRTRYDAGNSINLLEASGGRRCQLEQWSYGETTGQFARSARLSLG